MVSGGLEETQRLRNQILTELWVSFTLYNKNFCFDLVSLKNTAVQASWCVHENV